MIAYPHPGGVDTEIKERVMRQKRKKIDEMIRDATPALLSWLLWSYLAAATLYGAMQS